MARTIKNSALKITMVNFVAESRSFSLAALENALLGRYFPGADVLGLTARMLGKRLVTLHYNTVFL
jgi:hypothetical protein